MSGVPERDETERIAGIITEAERNIAVEFSELDRQDRRAWNDPLSKIQLGQRVSGTAEPDWDALYPQELIYTPSAAIKELAGKLKTKKP